MVRGPQKKMYSPFPGPQEEQKCVNWPHVQVSISNIYMLYIHWSQVLRKKGKQFHFPGPGLQIHYTYHIMYSPVPGPQWSKFPNPWQRRDRQQCTPPTIALITMLMFSKINIECKI